MRNNEDRFGPPVEEDTGPGPVSAATETPLNFVAPTEFVDLPSGGKLYPPGHPLHGKDTLEIKFMTAKEEDILTSKSLLRKGVAFDRMLQNLIVDKSVRLENMLTGDKNAILVASRISAYGEDYAVQVVCPACETKQKFEFNLSDLSHNQPEDPEDLGTSLTDRGTFLCTLPRSKVQAEFRLLLGRDEAEMTKEMAAKKESETASTKQLKTVLVSVNGQTDVRTVHSFVDNMPAVDARHLRKCIKGVTPDIDMTQKFVCSSCDHEEEMEVPLTAEFFWPK